MKETSSESWLVLTLKGSNVLIGASTACLSVWTDFTLKTKLIIPPRKTVCHGQSASDVPPCLRAELIGSQAFELLSRNSRRPAES